MNKCPSYNEAMRITKTNDLTRLLTRELGYQFARQSGSHAIYVKPNAASLSVPLHGKQIARGTLRQVLQIAYQVKG